MDRIMRVFQPSRPFLRRDGTAEMEAAAPDALRSSDSASRLTETSPAILPDQATTHEKPQQRIVHVDDSDRTIREAELEESDGGEGLLARWRIHRSRLANNRVRTSKYTLLTFLPRNLFEQFHRVAYIYFLVLILINQIPQLAIFGRYISVIPLLSVLTVTAIKDAFEDWRRHRADAQENERECFVYRGGQWCSATWQSIRVGELVHVRGDTTVPCDIVLLASSDPSGRAFVETMNLDGETNLKTRYSVSAALKNTESAAGVDEGRDSTGGGGNDGSPASKHDQEQQHSQQQPQQQLQEQNETQKHRKKQQQRSSRGSCLQPQQHISTLISSLQQKQGEGAEGWRGWVLTCESPSRNIYEFSGFLQQPSGKGSTGSTTSSTSSSTSTSSTNNTACVDARGGDSNGADETTAAVAAAALLDADESNGTRFGFGKVANATGCGTSSSTSAGSTTTASTISTCTSHVTATISPTITPEAPACSSVAVGPLNVLLRGCEVRNTAWVEGVAVYTGSDCKVVLNSVGAQSKRSRIESHLDRDMLLLALLLTVLCLICAIGMGVWLGSHDLPTLPYYGVSYYYLGVGGEAALNFFATLILLQVLVPISLYISMELVRIVQAVLMTCDRHMCDEEGDREAEASAGWKRHWVGSARGMRIGRWGRKKKRVGEGKGGEEAAVEEGVEVGKGAVVGAAGLDNGKGSGGGDGGVSRGKSESGLLCRALNINEDLGQVMHVLTDKTGTLTENRMAFHSCSVAGVDLHSLLTPTGKAFDTSSSAAAAAAAAAAAGASESEFIRRASAAPAAVGPSADARAVEVQGGAEPGAVSEADVEARSVQPPDGVGGLGPLQLSAGLAREFADVAGPGAGGVLDEFLLVLAACNNVVPTRVSVTASGELDMHAVSEGEDDVEDREEEEGEEEIEKEGDGRKEDAGEKHKGNGGLVMAAQNQSPGAASSVAADVKLGLLDVAAVPTADVASDDVAEELAEVIEYQGESPDEVALVKAAAGMGWQLVQRSEHHIVINVRGKDERYEVLGVHEFDSTRRRMSVVLRCPDGSAKLLVKGADSAVLSRAECEEDADKLPGAEEGGASGRGVGKGGRGRRRSGKGFGCYVSGCFVGAGAAAGPGAGARGREGEQSAAGTVMGDEIDEESEGEGDGDEEGDGEGEREEDGGLEEREDDAEVDAGESVREKGYPQHHNPSHDPSRQHLILSATERHIHQYSQTGLRTLVIAARPLPPAALHTWLAAYRAAARSLSADRDAQLAALADEMERWLQILGATGIEDRLQAGVPAALQMLRGAGMKVWMLTGDKVETGVSIARSCGLVRREDRVVRVSAGTERECERRLREVCGMEGSGVGEAGGLGEVEGVGIGRGEGGAAAVEEEEGDCRDGASRSSSSSVICGSSEVRGLNGASLGEDEGEGRTGEAVRKHMGAHRKHSGALGSWNAGSAAASCAMAIDGATLALALSPALRRLFFRASQRCSVVLCCRVAPMQKAAVVALVRQLSGELTLAIGDGANDVPMIQTAAIGVGIRGHEGRQAVMASDFAISQFRFLARLLLVHGHWNYHRMAYMIVYNLYKNTVFVLLLFWYLSQTAFSTTPAIGQLSLMFFSLTYTTLPTVVVASIDQTLLPTRLLAWPQLYGAGQREETYNLPVFLAAMLDATWQSLALFLVGVATVSGLDGDMWALGQTWLVALVLVVTVHLAMDIRRWTWLHAAAIAIAILVTVVSIVVIDYIPLLPEYGSFIPPPPPPPPPLCFVSLNHHTFPGVAAHPTPSPFRIAIATSTFWLDMLLMALLPRFCSTLVCLILNTMLSPPNQVVPIRHRHVNILVGRAADGGAGTAATLLGNACIKAAALGASDPALPGIVLAKALHIFTLDSGASRCFFRDSTTLTPLPALVPVRLVDPSGSLVLAHSSTVLPCPAVPSSSLSGLHLPSFSTNLVSTAALQDAMVTTTTPGGQRVSICTCTRTGRHLATFTRRPGSSLYTLTAVPPEVAASTQVLPSGPVAAPCSCRLLSHQTLLWHHRLGHTSLPRLRGMHSCLLVSGLQRSLPPLSPSPAPPCLPCVEGRQRAAPHSSSFPPMTAPLQTLNMDVWGPARVSGQYRECYFLLVVDDYTRYTTIFPLRSKGEVPDVLIPWIRAVRFQLRERFREDLPVLRLHSDRGALLCAIPCVFLGFPPNAFGWQFYHPTTRRVLPSQDVTFDESVPFYRLFPYRTAPLPPPPLFLAPGPPLVDPLPFQGPAPSGVSQVDPVPLAVHVEVAVDLGAARGAASGGAASWGAASGGAKPASAESGGAEPEGAESGGFESEGAESGGAEPEGVEPVGTEPEGAEPGGAESEDAESGGAKPRGTTYAEGPRTCIRNGAAGAGGSAAGGTGAAGPGGACTRGSGAAEAGGTGAGGAGAGGAGAGGTRAGGAGAGGAGAGGAGARGDGARDLGSGGAGAGGAGAGGPGAGGTVQRRPFFVPPQPSSLPPPDLVLRQVLNSPLRAPPYAEQTESRTEIREPESCLASAVHAVCTGHCVPRPRPPPAPGTHIMALRPSSVPLRVPLPSPPASSLPDVPDPESDLVRIASPTVTRLLATIVTDPSFESTDASALVAELVDFADASRLDYAASLVAESKPDCPPSVRGECALGTDVLEDRHENFECLAATVPHLVAMLLAPEGDTDALEIPTPRSYVEAIMGPYSSQWQIAMDVEMASWKSTGTYVDAVPPSGANIVDGMWIFRVKQLPGSPPVFKVL
ncbi:unnamed protein product [Closterium sp. NIES-53]